MDLSKDIRSLSDFKRNTGELMERMEESGEPMVLTVNGKAKLVVQDAASYQKLLESIDHDQALWRVRRRSTCGLPVRGSGACLLPFYVAERFRVFEASFISGASTSGPAKSIPRSAPGSCRRSER